MKADLFLNVELYDKYILDKAIHDYEKLAHISYKQDGDKYLLNFKFCRYGKSVTVLEFCNYLIDLQNITEVIWWS